MFMHAIGQRYCMNTIRESALKADLGRKISCCTKEVNLHQYYPWLFHPTLYKFMLGDKKMRGMCTVWISK